MKYSAIGYRSRWVSAETFSLRRWWKIWMFWAVIPGSIRMNSPSKINQILFISSILIRPKPQFSCLFLSELPYLWNRAILPRNQWSSLPRPSHDEPKDPHPSCWVIFIDKNREYRASLKRCTHSGGKKCNGYNFRIRPSSFFFKSQNFQFQPLQIILSARVAR